MTFQQFISNAKKRKVITAEIAEKAGALLAWNTHISEPSAGLLMAVLAEAKDYLTTAPATLALTIVTTFRTEPTR